jgi:tetratricopeptide (TPR) repeat protein
MYLQRFGLSLAILVCIFPIFVTTHEGQALTDMSLEIIRVGPDVERLYAEWSKTGSKDALKRAVQMQEKIVDKDGADWMARVSLAHLYYVSGDEVKAEHHALEALNLRPGSAQACKLLGRILVQMSRPREGLPHLAKAVSLAPLDHEGWYKVGTVFFELDDKESAARCFTLAGRLSRDPLHLLSAGHTLHKLGKDAMAYSLYAAAARANPRMVDVWNDFAFALSGRQRFREAEWAARKALAISETGDHLYIVANHVMSQKRYREACTLYERAAQKNPKSMDVFHNLGYCHHLAANTSAAVLAALRTCELSLTNTGITMDGKGQEPMYIAGLASALRRHKLLDLSVQVLASLEQPRVAGRHPKVIINDHLIVHRDLALKAIERVRAYVDQTARAQSDPRLQISSVYHALDRNAPKLPLPPAETLQVHPPRAQNEVRNVCARMYI